MMTAVQNLETVTTALVQYRIALDCCDTEDDESADDAFETSVDTLDTRSQETSEKFHDEGELERLESRLEYLLLDGR